MPFSASPSCGCSQLRSRWPASASTASASRSSAGSAPAAWPRSSSRYLRWRTSTTPRPGSTAAIKKEDKKRAKAGIPTAPSAISDEAIEERKTKSKVPQATPGVAVALDEFTNNCLAGDDPLDAILIAHQERFPGNVFRLINSDLPAVAGPQFVQVRDADGKAITAGGLNLGYLPEEVYDKAYRQPNLDRAARMVGQVKDPKPISERESGGDVSLSPADARLAPMEGGGLKIERSALSRA